MDAIALDDEIALRLLRPSDTHALTGLVHEAYRRADPLMPWWTELPTLADVRAWTERSREHRDGWLVIVRGEAAGMVGVRAEAPEADGAALECWIAPRFDAFSVRTRTCERAVRLAFTELRHDRLRFRCATEDGQAVALAEQLGFSVDGCDDEPAIYVRGGYRRIVRFTLDRADWHPRSVPGEKPERRAP